MTPARPAYSQQLASAGSFIREQDDFLVVSHVNPDGDAVSSTLAVGEMLRQLGKRHVLINEGSIPGKFDFLFGEETVLDYSDEPKVAFKAVISVDCADFKRIGEVSGLFSADTPLLNIDHHPTNDHFGTVQLIKPEAAATVEILYDLAAELKVEWTAALARYVYTGLLTDTGGFRYSNTTPHVMNVAAKMLSYGVQGSEIADRLLERMTLSQVRLLQNTLSTLTFDREGRIAWVGVSYADVQHLGVSNEDMEGLVNYPRNIEGVEVGILFKETEPGRFKASLRSAGQVNVAEVAQIFGGGGHVRASGCSLQGEYDEVVGAVVAEVGKRLP